MMHLPEKELLRPDEVAAYLSVTVRTVYNWVEEGRLQRADIPSVMRIFRESVVKYVGKYKGEDRGND